MPHPSRRYLPMRLSRYRRPLNKQGQASVLVLAFLGIVVLSAIFLYQSGRITSEKMQLQNAADAAAFGTSTLEARFMNYCAYTNRAMVANEVAIGQLIGILSLTDQIVSQGEYIQFYGELISPIADVLESIPCPIPIPEIIGAVLNVISEIMQEGGQAFAEIFKAIELALKMVEQVAVPILSGVNQMYWGTQEVVRLGTVFAASANLYQAIEDNSPNTKVGNPIDLLTKGASAEGVNISELGFMALGGHMVEFIDVLDFIPKFNFEKLQEKLDERLYKIMGQLLKQLSGVELNIGKLKEILEIEGSLFEKVGELDKHHYSPYVRRYFVPFFTFDKKDKGKGDEDKEDNDIEMDEYDREGNVIAREGGNTDKGHGEEKHEGGWKDFINFDKNQDIRKKGMRRFAATVREARDPFTSGSKTPITLHTKWGDIDYEGRGTNLTLGLKSNDKWFGNFFSFDTKMGFISSGGTELYNKNDQYAWTSMDVTNLKSVTHLELKGILKQGNDWIKRISKITGCTIDFQRMIDAYLHTLELAQLPAGNGFAQAGMPDTGLLRETIVKEKDMKIMALWVLLNGFLHMDNPTPAPDGYYGGALSPLNWSAFVPDIPGIELPIEPPGIFHRMKEKEQNEVDFYFGLPPYSDISLGNRPSDDPDDPPKLGFRFPFFIIGLVRGMEDTVSGGPKFGGRFDLVHDDQGKLPIKNMSVVAKSQVYFSRPDDLSYFLRTDKFEEKPNLFSPFWQARLVKTTNLDRLIFLAIQDGVFWLPKI